MRQTHQGSANHPFISLLYLVMLAIGGAVVFSIIGGLIAFMIYGMPAGVLSGSADLSDPYSLAFMKILQVFSSAGLFLAPPVIMARVENQPLFQWLKLRSPVSLSLFVLTLFIMLAGTPLLELVIEINKAMKMPGFLKDLEVWMLAQEKQMEELTKLLLVMKDPGDLVFNLFMIAVLPALSEELFFRGCVQRFFIRWTNNNHAGIWIAAIIFSTIHIQFYGFFPRMLLGALFGYLLVWSGNIWYPIAGHLINNGATIIAAYVYQQQGKSLDELDTVSEVSWPVYLVSAVTLTGLLWLFKKNALKLQVKTDGAGLG